MTMMMKTSNDDDMALMEHDQTQGSMVTQCEIFKCVSTLLVTNAQGVHADFWIGKEVFLYYSIYITWANGKGTAAKKR